MSGYQRTIVPTDSRPSNAAVPVVYQIDFTAVASGKRVASSKRRVRWRFGFANPEALANGETGTACRGEEHDITLVWSVTSGKRLILADGQEVHYSHARGGVFDFSWTMRGNHVLKIIAHASPPLSATPGFRQYDFFVDGQTFFTFPKVFRLGLSPGDPRGTAVPVQGHGQGRYNNYGTPGHRNPSGEIAKLEAPLNQDEEEAYLQEAIKNSLSESGPSGAPSSAPAPMSSEARNLLLDFFEDASTANGPIPTTAPPAPLAIQAPGDAYGANPAYGAPPPPTAPAAPGYGGTYPAPAPFGAPALPYGQPAAPAPAYGAPAVPPSYGAPGPAPADPTAFALVPSTNQSSAYAGYGYGAQQAPPPAPPAPPQNSYPQHAAPPPAHGFPGEAPPAFAAPPTTVQAPAPASAAPPDQHAYNAPPPIDPWAAGAAAAPDVATTPVYGQPPANFATPAPDPAATPSSLGFGSPQAQAFGTPGPAPVPGQQGGTFAPPGAEPAPVPADAPAPAPAYDPAAFTMTGLSGQVEQPASADPNMSLADQAYSKFANMANFDLVSKKDQPKANPFEAPASTTIGGNKSLADMQTSRTEPKKEIMKNYNAPAPSNSMVVSNQQSGNWGTAAAQYGAPAVGQAPQLGAPPQPGFGAPQASFGAAPPPLYGQQPQYGQAPQQPTGQPFGQHPYGQQFGQPPPPPQPGFGAPSYPQQGF